MKEYFFLKEPKSNEPLWNRRKGKDRRQVYDLDYFKNGGIERRVNPDRRENEEAEKILFL